MVHDSEHCVWRLFGDQGGRLQARQRTRAGHGLLISGTACGTSNNVDVRFNRTGTCSSGYFGTHSFRIDRLYSDMNQAGFGYACAPLTSTDGWTCTNWHINTIPCPYSRPV